MIQSESLMLLKQNLKIKIIYKEKLISNTLTSKEEFTLEFNQFIKEIDTSMIEIAADSITINASFKINKTFCCNQKARKIIIK